MQVVPKSARKYVQTFVQPKGPYEDSYWRKTLRLPRVPEEFRAKLHSEDAHATPHWREAVFLRPM